MNNDELNDDDLPKDGPEETEKPDASEETEASGELTDTAGEADPIIIEGNSVENLDQLLEKIKSTLGLDDDFELDTIQPELEEEFMELKPIPDYMQSAETDEPFKTCLECKEVLVDCDAYLIQKSWRHGEVIFEYTQCFNCHDKLTETFSKETTERLHQFFEEEAIGEPSLDRCTLCAMPRHEVLEYNIGIICHESSMVQGNFVCIDCVGRANKLFSKKTRDSWNDFMDNNFPGIPAESRPLLV